MVDEITDEQRSRIQPKLSAANPNDAVYMVHPDNGEIVAVPRDFIRDKEMSDGTVRPGALSKKFKFMTPEKRTEFFGKLQERLELQELEEGFDNTGGELLTAGTSALSGATGGVPGVMRGLSDDLFGLILQ